jgi:hypothetical protein
MFALVPVLAMFIRKWEYPSDWTFVLGIHALMVANGPIENKLGLLRNSTRPGGLPCKLDKPSIFSRLAQVLMVRLDENNW